MPKRTVTISRETIVRLWLLRQGLTSPRGTVPITQDAVVDHLTRTGALQLDSVYVTDRAHYLSLWSRFGPFKREQIDGWIYDDRIAYEYWGHEASILPISHLPFGLRRMRRFPPENWRNAAWWERYNAPPAVKRRVLQRLRQDGPLESADFERRPSDRSGWGIPKEDKRALQVLWHAGRVAVRRRRHFRRVYDLAERVYPEATPASSAAFEDSWLLIGLSGNGIASEKHLMNYWTAPAPNAKLRKHILARNLKAGRIAECHVPGMDGTYYGLIEHMDTLSQIPEPWGTTLICPFDSFLWQRQRAEDLLDFRYRIEIYVPPSKRKYGYYVLPILHNGKLVGRLDPKLYRDRNVLEIRHMHLEPGFQQDHSFVGGLRDSLASLATFLGADDLRVPRGWHKLL